MMHAMLRKLLVPCCVLCASLSAQADEWTGKDKTAHFAAGAVIGVAGMGLQSNDNPDRLANTLLLGSAVGLLKEGRDSLCKCGDVSAKDFLVTVAGTAVGAGFGLLVFPQKDGASLNFFKRF